MRDRIEATDKVAEVTYGKLRERGPVTRIGLIRLRGPIRPVLCLKFTIHPRKNLQARRAVLPKSLLFDSRTGFDPLIYVLIQSDLFRVSHDSKLVGDIDNRAIFDNKKLCQSADSVRRQSVSVATRFGSRDDFKNSARSIRLMLKRWPVWDPPSEVPCSIKRTSQRRVVI